MNWKWLPLWVVPVLVAMAVGTVYLRLSIVQTAYEIHQVDKMVQNARHESERLELRTAQLRSPRRLEELARTRYRLAPPRVDQVIRLKD